MLDPRDILGIKWRRGISLIVSSIAIPGYTKTGVVAYKGVLIDFYSEVEDN